MPKDTPELIGTIARGHYAGRDLILVRDDELEGDWWLVQIEGRHQYLWQSGLIGGRYNASTWTKEEARDRAQKYLRKVNDGKRTLSGIPQGLR